jgi:Putative Flp pilus-assembly TadE/G-like
MILVAVAMVAIIAMAALSIDVTTLYLSREEAQRSADSAALAAARVISMSGITNVVPSSDPADWQKICGGSTSAASVTAQAVAQENAVGGIAPTVNVSYATGAGASSSTNADCSTLADAFAVNPVVTVKITRSGLPTLFSRVWGRGGNSVSATATAEAFNPTNSSSGGNGAAGTITPVRPRCVKPWVVPNEDPWNPASCSGTGCTNFVNPTTGAIQRPGISLDGSGTSSVVGETFWLIPDCQASDPNSCRLRGGGVQPQANHNNTAFTPQYDLEYVPGQVGNTVTAIPSCSRGSPYEEAIDGCDAPTNYQCGVANANLVDMSQNPRNSGETTSGVQCLIHEGAPGNTQPDGQDTLNDSAYPFQILAGSSNPLGAGFQNNPISNSNSIVSLPIYDNPAVTIVNSAANQPVTFVGFLQVFVNAVDSNGNVNVTVLNVSGCGNGTNPTAAPVTGSSPVPVRLITPP